jgi:hypothetical protein
LWFHPHCFALDIPAEWKQHFDSRKNAQVFQPVDSSNNILIKYYAKAPLGKKDISDWLSNKLSNSTAPKGDWLNQATVIRDTANYAHGERYFQRPDGVTGHLVAVAVTADRAHARLAIMIYYDKAENKTLMKQAYQILTHIYDTEKADADKEGRKKNIEASPPKIDGIKAGGPIKPGRYVGSQTWGQEVKRHFELMLYDTGEYEFLRGYDKSGYYIYSQATGRLNMHKDFYNSSYHPKEEFCIYGSRENTGIPMIYAREDDNKYRLNWVNPVDRLSPRQRNQLDKIKNAGKGGYQYVTEPGKGISNEQIETILYTYKDNYSSGGIEIDEAIYLLMKDGRVRNGLPVAPNRLDVAKSRSREPDRWGWWKYDDMSYSFAWNIDRKHYSAPYGKQMRSIPIPAGTRMQGDWGGSSSFGSLDFSSVSFWGIQLDKSGRFKRYSNNMMQAGGLGAGYPSDLVTAYSDEEGSVVTVIGENIGGGTRSKSNRPNSHRIGSYEFDGYNLTLKYDNGVQRHLPTFATDDSFRGIWFEGGRLSRKD